MSGITGLRAHEARCWECGAVMTPDRLINGNVSAHCRDCRYNKLLHGTTKLPPPRALRPAHWRDWQ